MLRGRSRRAARRDAASLERRMAWVLGSPRSGSTWFSAMLGTLSGVMRIDEPTVGSHLALTVGGFVGLRARDVPADRLRVNEMLASRDDYLFAPRWADHWRPLVRELVVQRYRPQVEEWARARGGPPSVVCLKEPHGSIGADVLMAALPESRLLFLLRDGRDVVDSELDAASSGSWGSRTTEGFVPAEEDRLGYLRERAHLWVARTRAVQRAWDAHDPDRRLMVRYEDLLEDAAGELHRAATWLGLDVDEARCRDVASTLDADRLAPDQRGAGKFVRAAAAGGWRDNLGAEEQAEVDRIAGGTLRDMGYS